uniref:Uncharacterized protein n=1 Tax=Lotus japonicus TaxID=34305 RepID=I3SQ39_LOTJA|nr:unknown [Lotus japonicus]
MKRSLGNGFLSPVLLVKIIFNYTIGFVLSMVFRLQGIISFAKYNKSVDIIRYTDEEYDKHLTNPVFPYAGFMMSGFKKSKKQRGKFVTNLKGSASMILA